MIGILLAAGPPTTAVPGAHQDSADFFGPLIALVVIVAAIFVVRWALPTRRRREPTQEEGNDAPDTPERPSERGTEPGPE